MTLITKSLAILDLFKKEVAQEAMTTRKMLSRVPSDKYDWRPHPKSMNLKQLASHVAELPGWISMALETSELDFAKTPYTNKNIQSSEDLLAYFEESLKNGIAALEKATEEDLLENWTLRNGEEIYSVSSKEEVIRMSISQTIHHRAQLGVFLRLLDVPIPGSYGPSADDMKF